MALWKYTLANDYVWQSPFIFEKDFSFLDDNDNEWLSITSDGIFTVKQGYSWDGCSPKLKVFDWFYIGTPDGTGNNNTGYPKTYFASVIHDALYQFMDYPEMPLKRKEIDEIFYMHLHANQFSLRHVYFAAVRVFGGLFH